MVDFKFTLDISNLLGAFVFAILCLITYEKFPTQYILSKIILKRKISESSKSRDEEKQKASLDEITWKFTSEMF